MQYTITEKLGNQQMTSDLYKRAECFLPWNLQRRVYNSSIFPYWSDETLYYFQEASADKFLISVDIKSGKKETISSYSKLIDALSTQVQKKLTLKNYR